MAYYLLYYVQQKSLRVWSEQPENRQPEMQPDARKSDCKATFLGGGIRSPVITTTA